jgi:hypothetical protein
MPTPSADPPEYAGPVTERPPDAELNLWAIFHDGIVERIQHVGENVLLTVDVDFVRRHHAFPDGHRFEVCIGRATSLAVRRFALPQFSCPPLHGLPHDEQQRIVREWQAHGCTRSVSWELFAGAIGNPDVIYDLRRARVVPGSAAGHETLELYGMLEPEVHGYSVDLEGRDITFTSGGVPIEAEALVALGRAYWDASRPRPPA